MSRDATPGSRRGPVLLVWLAGTLVLLLAASRDWAVAAVSADDPRGPGLALTLRATGREAAPAVVALALAAAAAGLAAALTGRHVVRLLGAVGVVAAVGGAAAAAGVARDPGAAVADAAVRFGVDPATAAASAQVTAWGWVGLAAWGVPLVAALMTVSRGHRWRPRGTEDRRPAGVGGSASPSAAVVWEALSRGEDPT